MENEIWKEYPNNSNYVISNLGRVYSKPRLSKAGHKLKGKILSESKDKYGYIVVSINSRPRYKHQLVAETYLGHKPCGYKLVVNHINFDILDNKVDNLEIVTARENSNRKHLKSSSEFVGVSWYNQNNKWKATITINGKQKHLGYFKCELAAADAYQVALKELHVRCV